MTPAWDVLLERGPLYIKREAVERSGALTPDAEDAVQRGCAGAEGDGERPAL